MLVGAFVVVELVSWDVTPFHHSWTLAAHCHYAQVSELPYVYYILYMRNVMF